MTVYREAAEAMARGSMQRHRDLDEPIDWRNVNFAAPASAPPHGEKQMERLDHDQAQAHAENIRKAIQQQPTVEQGVAALFQAISTAIHNAIEGGDPGSLMALAKHVDGNARDWSDAILANTQAAPLTAGPRVPEMPVYVQDAFKSHGTLQHDQEQRQQEQRQADRPEDQAQAKQPDQPAQTGPQAPLPRSEQARQAQDNKPAMKA